MIGTRKRSGYRSFHAVTLAGFLLVWCFSCIPTAAAKGPRVLPEGEVPNDVRLKPLKDLNGYFPFEVPKSRQEWEQRASELRRRILVSTGVWPMPEKTPLNAVIHGRVERDDFTVEKVYFESYPGHYVTGLLFRPRNKAGRLPGVLCPHGHGGRLQDHGAEGIRKSIVQGEERFEGSGRYPKLARCAQLARMGCVVFIYDMVGYADSVQISRQLAHGFKKQRPDFDTPQSWGFFSTQAELRMQSIMGLQTYNSIRALDFLCQLPEVDPQRIGVTGGSGGGTQTILLCAIDPRPRVAFPQGMVSTAMQGGCTCENACCLRIGTGNVELAALFAPRPQGMTAANDWTKEMPTKGLPELEKIYALLGAKNNVTCKALLHFPHNYNYVTRALMYSWFNKHLGLGLKEPVVEEDFPPLTAAEWTVWDEDHPRPKGGPEYERSLIKTITDASNRQIAALKPTDSETLARYREVVGGAFDTLIGRGLPASGAIEAVNTAETDRGNHVEYTGLLRHGERGEELPAVALYPSEPPWNRQVVVWIDGHGKSGLFEDDGSPRAEIRKLLAAGTAVIGADLLYQGEFLADGKPLSQTPKVSNSREFAGYTFGYNHPLFAQRVHDVLAFISFVRHIDNPPDRVHLVGVAGAGPWVAAAKAQAGEAIDCTVVDTGGFRFKGLKSYRDVNFLPGAVKYGDLPGLLSLSAPQKLWLAGEDGKVPAIVAAAFEAAGRTGSVTSFAGKQKDVARAAVEWLLKN